MNTENLLSKENLSTLLVWLYVLIAPYIAQYISQEQFLTLGLIIIGVIGAIYSSKHPNTMFDKKPTEGTPKDDDATECGEEDGC